MLLGCRDPSREDENSWIITWIWKLSSQSWLDNSSGKECGYHGECGERREEDHTQE